jgi:hypothetical protein
MEKQQIEVHHESKINFASLKIGKAIKELQRLKKIGCEDIMINYKDYNNRFILLGIEYREETSEECAERISLYEDSKKREREKDLIEYSRLKEKLNL